MSDYHRPLYNFEVTMDFAKKVLGIAEDDPRLEDYVLRIIKEERTPQYAKDTLRNPASRDDAYKDENVRGVLRRQIVTEMMTFRRLADDEQVRLGIGGAMPNSQTIESKRRCFYVMGLPASGKSSICGTLCDMYGAYLLDSDLVKRKLPEFWGKKSGASMVHKESSIITMGGSFNNVPFTSLLELCYLSGYNICLPKIGNKLDDIKGLFSLLKYFGYSIYVILVEGMDSRKDS